MRTKEELEALFNEAAVSGMQPQQEQVVQESIAQEIPQEYADLFSLPTGPVAEPAQVVAQDALPRELNVANGEAQQYIEQLRQQHQQAIADASYYKGMAEAQAQLQANASQVTQTNQPTSSQYDLTEQEEAFLGENKGVFQKLVGRVAEEQIRKVEVRHAEVLNAFEQRLKDLHESQVQVQASAITTSFKEQVRTLSPDFEQTLRSPAWASYIKEIDPEHGVPRGQLINHYGNDNNARAVAFHINKVKSSTKQETTQKTPSPVGRSPSFAAPISLQQKPSINMSQVVGDDGLMAKLKAGKITRDEYKKRMEMVFNHA
jgi:hypothetical protein